MGSKCPVTKELRFQWEEGLGVALPYSISPFRYVHIYTHSQLLCVSNVLGVLIQKCLSARMFLCQVHNDHVCMHTLRRTYLVMYLCCFVLCI